MNFFLLIKKKVTVKEKIYIVFVIFMFPFCILLVTSSYIMLETFSRFNV